MAKQTTTTKPLFRREVIQPKPDSSTTKDDAMLAMERMVYEVSSYLENLEDAGKIHGNAHHAAQNIAAAARQEVESRWIE